MDDRTHLRVVSESIIRDHLYKAEKACVVCRKHFGTFSSKKHFCKTCFHAVCAECSPGQLYSLKERKVARACSNCVELYSSRRETEEQSRLNEVDTMRVRLEAAQVETNQQLAENRRLKKLLEQAAGVLQQLQQSGGIVLEKKDEQVEALSLKVEKKRRKVKALKEAVALLTGNSGTGGDQGAIDAYLEKAKTPGNRELAQLRKDLDVKTYSINLLEGKIEELRKQRADSEAEASACLSCSLS